MIEQLVKAFREGEPLFVGDVRSALSSSSVRVSYVLTLADGRRRKHGILSLPEGTPDDEVRTIAVDYIQAELYNMLTTLGGRRLDIFLEGRDEVRPLVEPVVAAFETQKPRDQRAGVGRVINVIERMLDALGTGVDTHRDGRARFVIAIHGGAGPEATENLRFTAPKTSVFSEVTTGLEGRTICGLDVGGTDIKAALVVDGSLVALKEHDWNPALFTDVEQIIDPILDIVRLLNAYRVFLTRSAAGEDVAIQLESCRAALSKEVTPQTLRAAVQQLEQDLSSERVIDAIGVCFPDVVVRNKVVGGEVPKTLGMRSNAERDFEDQFARLTALDEQLQALCRTGGVVMNTNDGPMAAFTAAVELAASPQADTVSEGVFAHTLGTDLGTGLVLADGSIPEIPLEVYNMILDIGSRAFRDLPANDVRSLRNTNTNIAGTMQRFTSQTGAFRLAQSYFANEAPDLLAAAAELGFLREETVAGRSITVVPEAPEDKRKAYLEHLMQMTAGEKAAESVFRDIGEFLARTWRETEHILNTGITRRFLFGRLVKVPRCFELMEEGAARRETGVKLLAADSSMAYTPLMKQLDASREFTVAQFGQAIGAVYYANLGLLSS